MRVAGCLADLAGVRGDAREAQARLEQLARDHSSRELSALQQMRVRLQRMLCACAQLRRDRAERARAAKPGERQEERGQAPQQLQQEQARLERQVAGLVLEMVSSGTGVTLAWTRRGGEDAWGAGAEGLEGLQGGGRDAAMHVPLTWNELTIQGLLLLTRGGPGGPQLLTRPQVLVLSQIAWPRLSVCDDDGGGGGGGGAVTLADVEALLAGPSPLLAHVVNVHLLELCFAAVNRARAGGGDKQALAGLRTQLVAHMSVLGVAPARSVPEVVLDILQACTR